MQKRDTEAGFRRNPLWTYFEIAEAHAWLLAGRPDRAWATLHWFWDHQASPGLYTWWEGDKEVDQFGRWEEVRGWVNAPHVTPHYWAAAEMLLLQLDMLVYVDQGENEPVVIVGAGIPPAWLARPMIVQGARTSVATVDWTWSGREMTVTVRGCRCQVRLGPAFAPDTPLRVVHLSGR
jgi:hypothetical protein